MRKPGSQWKQIFSLSLQLLLIQKPMQSLHFSVLLVGWSSKKKSKRQIYSSFELSNIRSTLFRPFVTGDYFETDWVAYTSAAVTGIGAALIWNSQATYIVLNSEIQNTYQGITSFWIIYQFRFATKQSQ